MSPAPGATWLCEAAPAKINLYLHVLGRRPDGFHRLDSLIVFAALHDTVAVAAHDGLRLEVGGPFGAALTGPAENNLVVRAARGLAAEAGVAPCAAIRLIKRLPVAAGIGGGSADAAAALRALCRLWRVSPGEARLRAVALKLGSDVPVCLESRAAFVGGLGDEVTPARGLPEAWLVLVNPGVPLATAQVFVTRAGPGSGAARFDARPGSLDALVDLLAARGNDLEAAAGDLVPELGETLDRIAQCPGCRLARMSGSGATCFGLFADAGEARGAATALRAQRPGWWAEAAPLLGALADLDPGPVDVPAPGG